MEALVLAAPRGRRACARYARSGPNRRGRDLTPGRAAAPHPAARRGNTFRTECQSGRQVHYHVAMACDRPVRFGPLKAALLEKHQLASHWGAFGGGYHSAVAYLYVPTPKKPLRDMDPEPLRWAAEEEHPPLSEASTAPVTAKAMGEHREKDRLRRAEQGKPGKFDDVDLWPIVVAQNFLPEEGARERIMSYARAAGGPEMVTFVFKHWSKMADLVKRCWEVERCAEYVAFLEKTRSQLIMEHLGKPCRCGGKWLPAALQLLRRNKIDVSEFRNAMVLAFEQGRSKGTLVTFAGRHGTEGKSFLLDAIKVVFGEDYVFTTPSKGSFPLLGLEKARVVVLDDWRFNELIISYNLQLLWFEGRPIIVARPQNVSSRSIDGGGGEGSGFAWRGFLGMPGVSRASRMAPSPPTSRHNHSGE